MAVFMPAIAWPDAMRRIHMSAEVLNSFSPTVSASACTLGERTLREPSAWQDWHEFLMVSTQSPWVFMNVGMPLPGFLSVFVPGNWSTAGIFSIEYQYMPG